ncbi:uncharacterized protein [Oscarella lobularis]|uniref:uncharacterized protein n=1 Tax=Oscarella lobularis TaxID=121494 RepID=UPI0033139089
MVFIRIVCVLLSLLSLTEGKLMSNIAINGRRQYLVSSLPTPTNFLNCSGWYTDSRRRGLAIHLTLLYNSTSADITKNDALGLYTYKCSDEKLEDGEIVPVSSAYCLFGGIDKIKSKAFSGKYDCSVVSADGSTPAPSTILVKEYDKEILVNVSQFPPSGVVDEGKPLTLSCEINRQSYRSPLKLEWRRNGDTAVDSQWLSDSIMPSYVYKKTAIPEDAGLYECVVTSKGAVIDTLKANQSVVINYAPRTSFYSAPFLNKMGEVHIPYFATNTFNCSADGHPEPDVSISLNKRTLKDVKENRGPGNTVIISKQWEATSRETQDFCCQASNKNGHAKEKCIRAIIEVPSISFFGVENATHGCPVEMNATLLCKAVGTSAPISVTISDPQDAVVAKSQTQANYTFTPDSKRGPYTCTASNNDAYIVSKKHHVCSTSLKLSIIIPIGIAVGIATVMIIAFVVYRRIRRYKQAEPKETDRLIYPGARERPGKKATPPTDRLINSVAEIVCKEWLDTFRAIEPSFREGEYFLQKVQAEERSDGDDDGDIRSAVRCLKRWTEENPDASFLEAVHEAAIAAEVGHDAVHQLCGLI